MNGKATGSVEGLIKAGRNVITNKHSRNTFFLILTIIIVLGLNALLPLIEGGAHYTEHAIECTYGEYLAMLEEDNKYALTYTSELEIINYKLAYRAANPHLSVEELFTVEIPNSLKVSVYTKFFFQSSSWYMTTATHIISTILIFYSVFNYILAKYKSTYKRYVDLEQELDTMNNQYLDPPTFEPWMVDKFNKPRKIRQHEVNVKTKLEKLESKTDYQTRIAYKKYSKELEKYNESVRAYNEYVKRCKEEGIEPDTFNKDRPIVTDKKLKKYIETRNKLNSLLDPFYIENYVVDGKVKNFVFIHPTFVTCGVNLVGSTTSDSYSLIQSDAQRLSKQAVSRVAKITGTTVMFALLTTMTVMSSFEKSWFWIVMNAAAKILPLLSQVINAYDYRDNFMDTQLIPNLQYRRTIAFLYLSDMKRLPEGTKEV